MASVCKAVGGIKELCCPVASPLGGKVSEEGQWGREDGSDQYREMTMAPLPWLCLD